MSLLSWLDRQRGPAQGNGGAEQTADRRAWPRHEKECAAQLLSSVQCFPSAEEQGKPGTEKPVLQGNSLHAPYQKKAQKESVQNENRTGGRAHVPPLDTCAAGANTASRLTKVQGGRSHVQTAKAKEMTEMSFLNKRMCSHKETQKRETLQTRNWELLENQEDKRVKSNSRK